MARNGMKTLFWLQAGSCGGCTMSALEAGSDGWFNELAAIGIDLLWHPSTSEQSAGEVVRLLSRIRDEQIAPDILCVEGSVIRGPGGTARFQMFGGTGRPTFAWVKDLASAANHVVAIGSCATFGGIPDGMGNITDACGLQFDGDDPGALLAADFVARGCAWKGFRPVLHDQARGRGDRPRPLDQLQHRQGAWRHDRGR